jgi:hypothetical protein
MTNRSSLFQALDEHRELTRNRTNLFSILDSPPVPARIPFASFFPNRGESNWSCALDSVLLSLKLVLLRIGFPLQSVASTTPPFQQVLELLSLSQGLFSLLLLPIISCSDSVAGTIRDNWRAKFQGAFMGGLGDGYGTTYQYLAPLQKLSKGDLPIGYDVL